MTGFRSLLFAPATRPDRFQGALTTRADAVCLDLEDAVPPDRKAEARASIRDLLANRVAAEGATLGVRINGTDTAWWRDDLNAIGKLADFVIVPKVITKQQIASLLPETNGRNIWALVETAAGLRNAWEIADATGVAGIMFGAFDYAADLGCKKDWEPLLFARSQIAAACAAAGIPALDAPSGEIRDLSGLSSEAERARDLGFSGKACIHPAQIAAVNRAFTPTTDEISEAEQILEALEKAGGGAAQWQGKLIEKPVAMAARRVLARKDHS